MPDTSSLKSKVLSFWFISVLVILIAVIAAVTLYLSMFYGEFAKESSEWSNFGSYIGGILGPLVSFVTLLAVIRTVYLQRELLDKQSTEMERMAALQLMTFQSQQSQIDQSRIVSAKEFCIKIIEMRVDMYERDFDRQNDLLFGYRTECGPDLEKEQMERVDVMLEFRDRARMFVDQLSQLALDISASQFSNDADVRKSLQVEIIEIQRRIEAALPRTVKRKSN